MRLQLKHLLHPLRSAKRAKALIAARCEMSTYREHGEHRYATDPRFSIEYVRAGFLDRLDSGEDTVILGRICEAYLRTVEREPAASVVYKPTPWWEQVRQSHLGSIIDALHQRDVPTLRDAYRNFFRDRCSAGLIGVPDGMSRPYSETRGAPCRLYLIDTLHRLDHWMMLTGGRFQWRDLAGPGIGNPFGVMVDGTLVETGAEYRHYCAQRLLGLLDSESASVAEIGGGFGGMAYYLLRSRPTLSYLDFDVPESIALASYYLMKAFPGLRFALYGENMTTRADVMLLPLFELPTMPSRCVDVTFSSHAVSAITPEAIPEYLRHIQRISRRYFLNIGAGRSVGMVCDLVAKGGDSFRLTERRRSEWENLKMPLADHVECVYVRE
jgi:hypothetical protein